MSRNIQKVYSPDVKPFSFEGNSGIFGTILSVLIGPIRISSRVMHNIFIMPADMLKNYATSLLLCAGVMEMLGIMEMLLIGKWVLAVSQLPLFYLGIRWKNQGELSEFAAEEKREVDINFDEVSDKCGEVYEELEKIVKE